MGGLRVCDRYMIVSFALMCQKGVSYLCTASMNSLEAMI